jgi:hypothetical protein
MAWPILAVVVALGVGMLVWKAMQGPLEVTPLRSVEPLDPSTVTVTKIPGAEIPGTDTLPPGPREKDPPTKPDPRVETVPRPPRESKERGDVTLVIIPEATVMKGAQLLGRGTMISFSLPMGTHLVTVTGQDGVKRHLSLQVAAGKNKAQKYRLDDLPPQ